MTPTHARLSEILPNPWNPHGMTDAEFGALRESIREQGAWRPILVVELDQPDEHTPHVPDGVRYRIVDGFHLHKALSAEALAAGNPDAQAAIFVLGKNSEVPLATQMEVGQTINHGLRGSLEDAAKTGRIVEVLSQHRPIEEIARRTGQSVNFLQAARRTVQEPSVRAVTPAAPPRRAPAAEREGQHVPLVFEDAGTLREFREQIGRAEALVDPQGKLTAGRRRVAAVMAALRALGDANLESA